ncbi:MAG: penicillin-binding transpeptidase domain-containing protein, partial [Lachnospiraceae bacterium]
VYLMVFCSEYYGQKAENLHERERDIKAARGEIVDCNGKVLATNKTVCTISVIHSQIENKERAITILAEELELPEEQIRKRVEKVSSIERIKSNVSKEVGDRIRSYGLSGIKVDEDYKRYYPFDSLASKVLGFTGGDNQGIIGLEVWYDQYLKGKNGKILTLTDARGMEIKNAGENRQDPISGLNLHVSLDYNIQMYAQQAAKKVMKEKSAENVCIILLNPKNGEIMAMVQVPEFNLNEPFKIVGDKQNKIEEDTIGKEKNTKKQQNKLNQMWRNTCLNDTYEPGSIFKIVTTAAAFEAGVLKETDQFYCPGYKVVEDRRIHCHQVRGHGAETFVDGIKNSCNPVFIEVGMRLGVERFYSYFDQFGILNKTGIDLPGEARTIMHAKEKMGQVELATVSFGQSFQITPIQLAATAASLLNGGTRITPHLGVSVSNAEGKTVEEFKYKKEEKIVSEETSAELCSLLEKVVSEGTGNKAYLEGYRIGGKTATSQTLPRSRNRYISSFLGFYPADNPQVLALITITNPKGIYYGGTIAAPVIRDIFQNIIPYMGVAFQ